MDAVFNITHCDTFTTSRRFDEIEDARDAAKEHLRWHRKEGWGTGYPVNIWRRDTLVERVSL